MVSAPYARKNGEKTKNCRSCRQGLYLEINFANHVDGHIIIYIFVPDPQTHSPHGPTCKRTDGHAEARTDTQTGGRTRRSTDADADARTQTPDGTQTLNIRASSVWVEKSSRCVLRLDERTRTFEVYYKGKTERCHPSFSFPDGYIVLITGLMEIQ